MDPSSEETLEFLLERLVNCCENHDKCRPQARIIPTRLIDVGQTIRLIDRPDNDGDTPRFLYLSACWGSDFALRLTRSNYAQLEKEILLEELPRTIRDAIVVAQALKIPYIWVDSLCILQDDLQSWKNEVMRMKDYLRSCTFTLGVASSRSLAAGFLDLRDDRRCYTFNARTIGSLPGAKVHLRPLLPSVWDSVSCEPLLTRLWPLQELTLCSRSILFGSSRIVWNCRTHMISDASESAFPPIWNQRLGFDVLLDENLSVRNEAKTVQGTINVTEVEPSTEIQPIYSAWHRIVELSSQLRVSFERDRLPALSGLASVFKQKLDGDVYIMGLWMSNLPRDLLWHRAGTALRRMVDNSIPSWSWAAYTGRISYPGHDFQAFGVLKGVEIHLQPHLSSKLDKTDQQRIDVFGEHELTNIDIMTYSVGYNQLIRVLGFEGRDGAKWEETLDSTNESSYWLDSDYEMEVQSSKIEEDLEIKAKPELQRRKVDAPRMSVLAIANSVDRDYNTYVALVVEELDDGTYRRVGVGTLFCPPSLTYRDYEFSKEFFRLV